tara:strand:+ start:108 stop:491 length:384 start_codon:yes stop_codon:yes gene_type:complete
MEATSSSLTKEDWLTIACVSLLTALIVSMIINFSTYDTISSRLGLDDLYRDFDGNKDADARMTARIDISTDKGACNIDVIYEGDKYRNVDARGGDSDLCDKYSHSKEKGTSGEFMDRLLDQEYIDRI